MLGDRALADLVASGDQRAFEVIYERHRAEIFRYCSALTRHPQDAEEAFQLTMLSAYRALSSRGPTFRELRPWLFRIAHNECMDLLRARPRSEELTEHADPVAGAMHERAELREQLRVLRTDIAALPLRQRSALVMHEMNGLSHAAVGEALGTDAADARRLLHEARVSLAAFGMGRDLDCREVRATIADGDRRALRARTLKAHLRGCEGCAAFAAEQDERRRRLGAYLPVLPALAAARILQGVLDAPVPARAAAGALGAGGVAVASGGSGSGGAGAGGSGGGGAGAGAAAGLGALAVTGIVAAAAVAVGAVATVALTVSGIGPFASPPPPRASAAAVAPAAASNAPPSSGAAHTGTPAA
ncbi:MAG: RNA polymerase sigma factor, partial [Thermoleophilia bacterium]